ncbi:MAG: HAD hydrolase family protein [Clostridiales bacterium]|nr:HAD hydrolase family protein [Clostridiales bacterium]
MNVFFTDLDNTLIYSHRRTTGSDMVLAERLNGKEQSYMPEALYLFLKEDRFFTIVPVTSRTAEQFRRIFLLKELGCDRAFVCNGGIFLDHGIEDSKWKEKTMAISEYQQPEIAKAYDILTAFLPVEKIHYVEPFYLYAVVGKGEDKDAHSSPLLNMQVENIHNYLSVILNQDSVDIYSDERKVYVICKSINKGLAIKRYKELNDMNITVAAGDSFQDISMFDMVDYGIALEKLRIICQNKNMVYASEKMFSNTIYNTLYEIKERGR